MLQYWLVIDNKKQGPFTSSQVNKGIRQGSYSADTKVWYRGLDDWKQLKDLPHFAELFIEQDAEKVADVEVVQTEEVAATNYVPINVVAGCGWLRRIFAYAFDILLVITGYILIDKQAMVDLLMQAQQNQINLASLFKLYLLYGLLVFVQIFCFQTTAGMVLLGMKVTSLVEGAARPSALQSLLRSLISTVMVATALYVIEVLLCLFRPNRSSTWDQVAKTTVVTDQPTLNGSRRMAFIGIMFFLCYLFGLLIEKDIARSEKQKLEVKEEQLLKSKLY